jgi:serine/threonine-protein kinase
LGRYEILGLLGTGTTSNVYLARDSALDRKVAVKTLREDLSDRSAAGANLRRAARKQSQLTHPNLVAVHDIGEDPEAGVFVVLEYVEPPSLPDAKGPSGEVPHSFSLADRLKEGPVRGAELVRMARALGDALTFAHDRDTVHGDLKPDNVLIGRNGIKVTDFNAPVPSDFAKWPGAPAYGAPEGSASTRADQFAFAAILQELVTGTRAFPGDPNEASQRIRDGHAIAVEAADVDLGGVRGVLYKGLSPVAADRFVSSRALGDAFAHAFASANLFAPGLPSADAFATGAYNEGRASIPPDSAVDSMNGVPTSLRRGLETGVESSVRRRTQRVQNVAIGAAIVVFVGLYIWGRRAPTTSLTGDIVDRAASATSTSTQVSKPPKTKAPTTP